MMRRVVKQWVVGLVSLSCLYSASANEANYQHYQVGDRAAGMGGGISAIADGIDACYYNPAGLTRTPNNTLSLSANLYGFQQYESDDAMFPGERFKTDSFHSVPSTAGGIFRLSTNVIAAFSAFIPKKGSFFETIAFPDKQHYYTLSQDFQTLWLGPSLGYTFTPKLSLGASLFGVYETYNAQQSLLWADYDYAYAMGVKYNSLDMLGMLGLQYRLDEYWSLGFTFQTPSANLTSDGEWLEDDVDSSTQGGSGVHYADGLEAENLTPAKFVLGLAREVPGIWAVGVDVSYHLAESYTRLKGTTEDGVEFEVPVKREPVVDVNVGGEYVLLGKYPLRAGFFTSHSSAPDLDVNESHYPAQIDLYGLTCTAGTKTRNSAVNLGVNYIFGSGDDFGWAMQDGYLQRVIVDANERYLYFIFNTSYYF
jgi:hypothetical protein